MRVALISDIHGNAIALEAVLEDIQQENINTIICLGDIATIGPEPLKVLEIIQDLNIPCVMGNHDAALLQPEKSADYHIASPLQPVLEWCAARVSPADREFLAKLPLVYSQPLSEQHALFCFHGSPNSNTDNLLATTPSDRLTALLSEHNASVMACGHTHIQMLRQHDSTLLINPGSVGQPFLNTPIPGNPPVLMQWAEYAIVQANNGKLNVDLRRIPYSIPALRKAIIDSGIPLRDWWLQQYNSH